MNATVNVFIGHLAGIAVFDPDGDQVGRVRDVIVLLRPSPQRSRILGLVVEVQPRRPIFVPMTRVTSVAPGQVVTTGSLDLRRFSQRPSETLALGELIDRQVTLTETGETVTVLDIGMERTRVKDWEITKVHVRKGGRKLGRRGENLTVDWNAVSGFSLPEKNQGAAGLVATFDKLPPADLAHVMHDLSAKRRAEVAATLDDDRLADVLEELSEDDQIEILGKLKRERAADVLEAMEPDDAADLLAELPPEEAEDLLTRMEPTEAGPVRRLLSYPDNTAGGLMNPEPIILPPDATIAEALARVREPQRGPSLAVQVYVCRPPTDTPTGRYLGIAHIQRLLREPPADLVSAVVDDDIAPLGPTVSLPTVAHHLAAYNLMAAPIVDSDGRLLGTVTVDDVLDHLLPQDWRDHPLESHAAESHAAESHTPERELSGGAG